MSITDDFKYVLEIVGLNDDHLKIMSKGGFNKMSHLRTRDRQTFEETLTMIGLPVGTVWHVSALSAWYEKWRMTPAQQKEPVREAFTEETWEDFLDGYSTTF